MFISYLLVLFLFNLCDFFLFALHVIVLLLLRVLSFGLRVFTFLFLRQFFLVLLFDRFDFLFQLLLLFLGSSSCFVDDWRTKSPIFRVALTDVEEILGKSESALTNQWVLYFTLLSGVMSTVGDGLKQMSQAFADASATLRRCHTFTSAIVARL